MGAEIGIATGSFHARGPVGVEQLTTFKYVVRGQGQTRPKIRLGRALSKKKHAEKKRANRRGDAKGSVASPAQAGSDAAADGGAQYAHRPARRLVQPAARRRIARSASTALKRLGLDQVWWLVTPGNPLKDASKLASLASPHRGRARLGEAPAHRRHRLRGRQRLRLYDRPARRAQAPLSGRQLRVADGRRQSRRNSIAGAPGRRSSPPCRSPCSTAPGFRLKARAGKAAQRFAAYQVDESDARGLARLEPPAWTILTHSCRVFPRPRCEPRKPGKEGERQGQEGQEKAEATLAIETSAAAILCLWREAATVGSVLRLVRDG